MNTNHHRRILRATAFRGMAERIAAAAFLILTVGNMLSAQAVPANAQPSYLKAVPSKKCLDIPGASLASGIQVIQFECNFPPHQMFMEQFVDGPWALYVAGHSGKCLEVNED